jgi:Sortase domain
VPPGSAPQGRRFVRGHHLVASGFVALVALLGACALGPTGTPDVPPLSRPAASGAPASQAPPVVVARPTVVAIPAVDLTARLVPLGLDEDGALEPPVDFDVAGWYADGPEPGEPGPTVIAGHVDSYVGPAAFYRLGDVSRGDDVLVTGADGTTLRYVVERVEQHAKTAFPTDEVYAPTDGSALRLITCGGAFDHDAGHYDDNVVVFAAPAP